MVIMIRLLHLDFLIIFLHFRVFVEQVYNLIHCIRKVQFSWISRLNGSYPIVKLIIFIENNIQINGIEPTPPWPDKRHEGKNIDVIFIAIFLVYCCQSVERRKRRFLLSIRSFHSLLCKNMRFSFNQQPIANFHSVTTTFAGHCKLPLQ